MTWSSPLFWGARTVLVSANDGRVDRHEFIVGVCRQSRENPRKCASFAPMTITQARRFPVTVAFGKIAPRDASSIAKVNRIHEKPIVSGSAADMAFAPGQKVFDPVPLIVAQSVAEHGSAS